MAIGVQAHFMPDVQREALAGHTARSPELAAPLGPVLSAPPYAKLARRDSARIAEMDAGPPVPQPLEVCVDDIESARLPRAER